MFKDIKFSPRDNRLTREDLRESLERYSRAGFQDILSEMMQCRPDTASMVAWATEHPGKWAAALSIMARLAGYTDTTVSLNIDMDLSKLGDAQLLHRLQELRQQSSHTIKTIEHTPQESVPLSDQPLAQSVPEDIDAKLIALIEKKKRKTP